MTAHVLPAAWQRHPMATAARAAYAVWASPDDPPWDTLSRHQQARWMDVAAAAREADVGQRSKLMCHAEDRR